MSQVKFEKDDTAAIRLAVDRRYSPMLGTVRKDQIGMLLTFRQEYFGNDLGFIDPASDAWFKRTNCFEMNWNNAPLTIDLSQTVFNINMFGRHTMSLTVPECPLMAVLYKNPVVIPKDDAAEPLVALMRLQDKFEGLLAQAQRDAAAMYAIVRPCSSLQAIRAKCHELEQFYPDVPEIHANKPDLALSRAPQADALMRNLGLAMPADEAA